MPLSRYQIRNEYSLADPKLYKVANKDDPEALLEGVAMAGLVGVLRQLGDLAEFAAEIFHDLHEEVMATAARGHGLIVRVQQLEAEFPFVERTLLSQTSHTAFLYNSGIDWHPNARMDENAVTRGDLPRFVMDSYEECRGPPRLFLLDKFDLAGAGACLKRFTDPSFFKAAAAPSTGKRLDGLREKRARRVKKRGPRWRNEATPETYQSSHAKLHQLFLEEVIETGGTDPDCRVKLKKRQFTGSLFDKEKTRSYMEKILDSCSSEQKIIHEVCIDALPLPWTSDIGCETSLEIVEIGTHSPFNESADIRKVLIKPSLKISSEGKLNYTIDTTMQERRPSHDSDDGKMSSASYKVRSEEGLTERQSRSEGSDGDGGNSDDIASEVDNYMDAFATMESEVETDSECNDNQRYLYLKPVVVDSDLSKGLREPHNSFWDSQSLGNSTASDDGYNFFKERQSASRSMSVKSLTDTTPYLNTAVGAVSSVPACNSDADNVSLENHSTSEHMSKSKTEDGSLAVEADEPSKTVQEYASSCSHLDPKDTIHSLVMEDTLSEKSLPNPGLDEPCSNSADPEILSAMSNQRHANQTNNSSARTVLDATERTDGGHWSNAQLPMNDLASHGSSVCSESLLDPATTPDDLPKKEHNEADSPTSVEECSNDFGMEDVTDICDPNVREMVKNIDGVSNLDICITSVEEDSNDQYSPSDSRVKLNYLEQSAVINPTHPPDYAVPAATAAFDSSQGDFVTKEVFTNARSEEKVSSAAIVGQPENFHLPISSGLSTCASDSSLSGTTDAAETGEHGSLQASITSKVSSGVESNGGVPSRSAIGEFMGGLTMMEKACPVLDPSESAYQLQRLPSEITDTVLLEHPLAETGNQYPLKETSQVQNCVSASGDEYKAALGVVAFGGDVCQDVTSVYSNLIGPVEAVEHSDKSESWAVQDDATSGHGCDNMHDDKDKASSHDKFLFDEPSRFPKSSSSVSATQSDSSQLHDMERLEHNETRSGGSRQLDDVEDCPADNLLLFSSSSVCLDKVQESVSATGDYYQKEEELTLCPSTEPIAQEKTDPVHDTPASLHFHGQPSMLKLRAQPDAYVMGGFTQPMVESTSFLPGNNMLSGTNQATQLCENLGQPIQTPGFPVPGMLLAEPQINLDSPPLPPLPPVQWRLSRLQGSSSAADGQMVPHIHAPLQPITLPGIGSETDPFSHTSNGLGQPGYPKDLEKQGVYTHPLLVPASEVLLQNNVNDIEGENLSVANSKSTWSLIGTQISEESHQLSVNFVEPESSANHASGDDSLVMKAKVDAENNVQNYQLEQNPQVAEQEVEITDVPFVSSSPVHCDWQPPPGLMAPEAQMTWLSAHDGMPNDGVYPIGALQKKPSRPRNPLIYEVVAIDKSKLRKVERVKPSIESKLEEGESFLEQLQLRKVERVKPPFESKTQEGESLLEHLHLRKVKERVRPPVEPNSEEREFSLPQLQLRKVEDIVKPQTELKTERELPLEHIQLRKVEEKVKSEAEQKPEETESPRVQLRKVSERVKPEIQQNPEDTESPRLQLRKVSEKFKKEVEQKVEGTESPRVQLRKVGQTAAPSVAPKTEERDSILEQIRNKSFSLKPAVAARPNIQGIQGHRTNLKVAAIIEKASTIRQAMAGSDEEDDADDWSDD